jgi:3',5'-cyclic AMP phosphodiesterase CpdA
MSIQKHHLAALQRKRADVGEAADAIIGWLTDIHIGRNDVFVGTFDPGEPEDSWDQLATFLEPGAKVIVSGDVTEQSTDAEFTSYASKLAGSDLAAMTLHYLPGNHDEGEGLDPSGTVNGEVATFEEYEDAGYGFEWTFTAGEFQFIGFTTIVQREPDANPGKGKLKTGALAYVAAQLEVARIAGKVPVLVSHYPLRDSIGENLDGSDQTALYALITAYQVPLYLSGHRHLLFSAVAKVDDESYPDAEIDPTIPYLYHVNGQCNAYTIASVGGFHVISLTGLAFKLDVYSRLSPYAQLDTETVSCAARDVTPPTVTARSIDLTGTELTMTLSEAVSFGAGGNTGFAITPSGGAATLTYASGSGTNTLVYDISRPILLGETATLDYTQPGSGVVDTTQNPLATFSGASVTNNSTATDDFEYVSVVLDGNDRINRGADLTGLSDGKQFYLSFWFKCAADAEQSVFGSSAQTVHVQLNNAAGVMRITAQNSAASTILDLRTAGQYRDNAWHHVMISVDLTDTGKRHLYVDGVSDLVAFTYTDDNMDLTPGDWSVGSRGDAFAQYSGKLCEFVFGNTYIDLSNATNREKFRTSGGEPEDILGAGLTPIIYLTNPVPAWHENEGSGGDFSENGTLVDGGVDVPP